MKAPDKIYIQDYNIPEFGLSNLYSVERVENDAVHSIEYICKDALMEWARLGLEMLDADTHPVAQAARAVFNGLIDKLNEM